ncbi:hypothetical protein V1478_002850, partial [Vespula squamosa]
MTNPLLASVKQSVNKELGSFSALTRRTFHFRKLSLDRSLENIVYVTNVCMYVCMYVSMYKSGSDTNSQEQPLSTKELIDM